MKKIMFWCLFLSMTYACDLDHKKYIHSELKYAVEVWEYRKSYECESYYNEAAENCFEAYSHGHVSKLIFGKSFVEVSEK